jgi:hypothetical protein
MVRLYRQDRFPVSTPKQLISFGEAASLLCPNVRRSFVRNRAKQKLRPKSGEAEASSEIGRSRSFAKIVKIDDSPAEASPGRSFAATLLGPSFLLQLPIRHPTLTSVSALPCLKLESELRVPSAPTPNFPNTRPPGLEPGLETSQ